MPNDRGVDGNRECLDNLKMLLSGQGIEKVTVKSLTTVQTEVRVPQTNEMGTLPLLTRLPQTAAAHCRSSGSVTAAAKSLCPLRSGSFTAKVWYSSPYPLFETTRFANSAFKCLRSPTSWTLMPFFWCKPEHGSRTSRGACDDSVRPVFTLYESWVHPPLPAMSAPINASQPTDDLDRLHQLATSKKTWGERPSHSARQKRILVFLFAPPLCSWGGSSYTEINCPGSMLDCRHKVEVSFWDVMLNQSEELTFGEAGFGEKSKQSNPPKPEGQREERLNHWGERDKRLADYDSVKVVAGEQISQTGLIGDWMGG
ncbi:hypothetical protein C8R45DRAFT_929013 [Mycena sanguinolenta]|nr:hypothetical protein C8R45DRAFT_929013 [Mycena sanguinolenta]